MLPNKLDFFKYQAVDKGEDIQSYANLVESRIKTYDRNYQAESLLEDKLSEMKLKSSKEDSVYVDGMINKIRENFDKVATTVAGNKRYDLANRAVDDSTLAVMKDVNLKAIKQSFDNYQDKLDAENKLRASGKVAIDLADDFDNHRSINPDGSFNTYRHQVQAEADYQGEKYNYIKLIKEQAHEKALQLSGDDDYKVSITEKGITEEMIREKLPALLRSYNGTDTGKQEKAVLRKRFKNLSDSDFDKFYNNEIATDFSALGNIVAGTSTSNQYVTNHEWLEEQKMKRALLVKQGKGYDEDDSELEIKDGGEVVHNNADGTAGKTRYKILGNKLNEVLKKNLGSSIGVNSLIPMNKSDIEGFEDGVVKSYDITGVNYRNSNYNSNLSGAVKVRATIQKSDGKGVKVVDAYLPNPSETLRNQFSVLTRIENVAKNAKPNTDNFSTSSQDKTVFALQNPNINTGIITNPNVGVSIRTDKNNNHVVIPTIKDGNRFRPMSKEETQALGLESSYSTTKLADNIMNNQGEYLRKQAKTTKQVSESETIVE